MMKLLENAGFALKHIERFPIAHLRQMKLFDGNRAARGEVERLVRRPHAPLPQHAFDAIPILQNVSLFHAENNSE